MEKPAELLALESILARCDGLDSFGILPHSRLEHWIYEQTPPNCVTFASTGGDGVHFSLACDAQHTQLTGPVIMTVPMASEPNRVVGRNLHQFLGLGLHSGYFVLEQLQYDLDATCAALDRREYEQYLGSQELAALDAIRKELDVRPWSDHRAELELLAHAFPI